MGKDVKIMKEMNKKERIRTEEFILIPKYQYENLLSARERLSMVMHVLLRYDGYDVESIIKMMLDIPEKTKPIKDEEK